MSTELDLDFDTDEFAPVEKRYRVKGVEYILHSADGAKAAKFKNEKLARMTLGESGSPKSLNNMGDIEAILVQLCSTDLDGKPVPLATVKSWGHKVVTKLFDLAKLISYIDQPETLEDIDKQIALLQKARAELLKGEEDSKVKNLPEDMTDGSD
jgi:hypothetical protein